MKTESFKVYLLRGEEGGGNPTWLHPITGTRKLFDEKIYLWQQGNDLHATLFTHLNPILHPNYSVKTLTKITCIYP
jgi:hypothetical protein